MADKKISALTGATTPLAGTEVLPIVQSGATVKVAVSDLTAGRAISATSVTASTGNFVVGTSGQGIDFSATPGTGTSELLADYEEGTWTPSLDAGWTVLGTPSLYGSYIKIGSQVWIYGNLQYSTTLTSSGGNTRVTGLPYTQNANMNGVPVPVSLDNLSQPGTGFFSGVGAGIYFPAFTAGSAHCVFQFTYFV
jgi:hypothetical protein